MCTIGCDWLLDVELLNLKFLHGYVVTEIASPTVSTC